VTLGLLTLLLGGGYAVVVLGGSARSWARAPASRSPPPPWRSPRCSSRQVDLDTLTGELLAVVEETMQPTRASLWLRAHHSPEGPG
jgi:hypothetical protein